MDLIFLTQKFYDDNSENTELSIKELRPYILFVVCYNGLDFGIPFRSNISHKYFHKTSTEINAGIDYTKSVVISDEKYIDKSKNPILREDEYKNIIGKEHFIKEKFIKYIKNYKKAFVKVVEGKAHPRDINLCKFSTLQYYHKEIGIQEKFSDNL